MGSEATDEAMTTLLVQHIVLQWTKRSRGMPNAARRNAVPTRYAVPTPTVPGTMHVHEVRSAEWQDFRPEQSLASLDPVQKQGPFGFTVHDGELTVSYTYSGLTFGQPNRGRYRHRLFRLKTGETGRFLINGRFSSYSGQWYAQHVLNVAWLAAFDADVFLGGSPTYEVNKLVHLF